MHTAPQYVKHVHTFCERWSMQRRTEREVEMKGKFSFGLVFQSGGRAKSVCLDNANNCIIKKRQSERGRKGNYPFCHNTCRLKGYCLPAVTSSTTWRCSSVNHVFSCCLSARPEWADSSKSDGRYLRWNRLPIQGWMKLRVCICVWLHTESVGRRVCVCVTKRSTCLWAWERAASSCAQSASLCAEVFMLSFSAFSSSLIRSAVSRIASWEAEEGCWGVIGV